jgi:hypothetical protein
MNTEMINGVEQFADEYSDEEEYDYEPCNIKSCKEFGCVGIHTMHFCVNHSIEYQNAKYIQELKAQDIKKDEEIARLTDLLTRYK